MAFKHWHRVWGIIFLFIALLDSYYIIANHATTQLLWFCDVVLYVLALGFFFKKALFVNGVLLGALIVQTPWVFDFVVNVFAESPFGFSEFIFEYGFYDIRFYIELDHLLILPAALVGTWILGFHRKAWIFTVVGATLLVLTGYYISPLEDNVNCAQYSCFIETPEHKASLARPLGGLLLLSLAFYTVNQLIVWLIRKKKIKIKEVSGAALR